MHGGSWGILSVADEMPFLLRTSPWRGFDLQTGLILNPSKNAFQNIIRYDEVIVELTEKEGIIIEISGDSQNIPSNPSDNTAGLALMELFKRKKIQQGIKLSIIKNMTSGGGLGTTGASAIGAIYGVNKLLNLNLSENEIIEYASYGEVASGGSPHADNVSAALLGGFVKAEKDRP